jgi:hypothetical protein
MLLILLLLLLLKVSRRCCPWGLPRLLLCRRCCGLLCCCELCQRSQAVHQLHIIGGVGGVAQVRLALLQQLVGGGPPAPPTKNGDRHKDVSGVVGARRRAVTGLLRGAAYQRHQPNKLLARA